MDKADVPADLQPVRKTKLAFFVSHPIQYQAPLLRRLQQESNLDLAVFFFSDRSVRGYWDQGFNKMVEWDVPLLDGYRYEFLPQLLKERATTGKFFHPLNQGIIQALRKNRFDIVWTHGYFTLNSLIVMAAAKAFGSKVALTSDSSSLVNTNSFLKEAVKRTYMSIVHALVDCTLVVGKTNHAYWRRYFGDRMAYYSFPYSVDNQYFRQRVQGADVPEIRKKLGLESGRPVILYASKLQKRKRCTDLILAYQQVIKKTESTNAPYLLIAGDGEERQALEQAVAAANLTQVRFLGFQNQSELPALFALCDVFVLPSANEPWGLIVNEVMNAGRPVVVTDQVGCQQDLVENGVNGYVYSVGDVPALSGILEKLIADPELRKRMGEESLRIIDNHSYEQCVEGLQAFIKTMHPA